MADFIPVRLLPRSARRAVARGERHALAADQVKRLSRPSAYIEGAAGYLFDDDGSSRRLARKAGGRVTRENIAKLRDESARAGDVAMVVICDRALHGSARARAAVRRVLARAAGSRR